MFKQLKEFIRTIKNREILLFDFEKINRDMDKYFTLENQEAFAKYVAEVSEFYKLPEISFLISTASEPKGKCEFFMYDLAGKNSILNDYWNPRYKNKLNWIKLSSYKLKGTHFYSMVRFSFRIENIKIIENLCGLILIRAFLSGFTDIVIEGAKFQLQIEKEAMT